MSLAGFHNELSTLILTLQNLISVPSEDSDQPEYPSSDRPLLCTLRVAHNLSFLYADDENLTEYLSLVMRKPAFCICENKDADQLRGNREADQRLCFRSTDSTIPLLSKSEISSF